MPRLFGRSIPTLRALKSPIFLPLVPFLLVTIPAASAAILVNDNFTNASMVVIANPQTRTLIDSEATGVGSYQRLHDTGFFEVNSTSALGSGNSMALADNNSSTLYRAFNGGQTLNLGTMASGDSLSLSFNVRFGGAGSAFGANAENFGFGFTSTTSPANIAYVNVDARSGSPSSEFRYRTGSAFMGNSGSTIGANWTNSTAVNTTYLFSFSITKIAATNYLLEYFRDGTLIHSETNTLTNTRNIDIEGVSFRWGENSGVTTFIDNVVVEHIPEPSAALLGFAGAVPLLFARRRKAAR